MYKFAIVEDNEAAAEKLAGFLERYANENNEVFEIIKFHDALDFLDGYRTVYDAVFYGYRDAGNRWDGSGTQASQTGSEGNTCVCYKYGKLCSKRL